MRHAANYPPGAPSYNVPLTLGHMYVFPRRKDAYVLVVSGERFGVNALGFAGFLVVKSPAELGAVVTEGPAKILEDVICESVHEMQVAGGPDLDADRGDAIGNFDMRSFFGFFLIKKGRSSCRQRCVYKSENGGHETNKYTDFLVETVRWKNI